MIETSQIRLPRAILFDHDGTLVASESVHWGAWGNLLRELDIPYAESDIQKMVGMTAPEIMTRLLNQHKPGWTSTHYDVHALARRKNDHYLERAKVELKAYPGVHEGIQWCRANGIKTAVVSNAKRRELELALSWVGLLADFDLVISRDEAVKPKPDPAGFLMAAALLELDVSECLAVEDSPTGIEASLIAKVPSAAVLTNFSRQVMNSPVPGRPDLKPVWIGNSIAELFESLKILLHP